MANQSWWPWPTDWNQMAQQLFPPLGGAEQLPGDISSAWNWLQDDSQSWSMGDIVNAIAGPSQAGTPAAGPAGQQSSGMTVQQMLQALGLGAGGAGTGGAGGRGGGGAGGGAGGGPPQYVTPDGVTITDGSPEDTYYKMADAIWTKNYGTHPPFSIVQTFHDLGISNTSQLEQVMEGMPSHVRNQDGSFVPMGQYNDARTVAQTLSDKYLGRPAPDSLIQQFFDKGIANPQGIELWFMNHPAKDIPKDAYGAIYDQAQAWTTKTWNDLPHPDQVAYIYNSMQGQQK